MSFGRALAALAIFLLLSAPLLRAEEGSCLRRTMAVNVHDEEGNRVSGLTPADFRGTFRGQAVRILSVEVDHAPRRIVVLLDISGSMTDRNKWEVARTMAEDIVLFAPVENSVALIVFAEEVVDRVDFAQGRSAVAEKLTAMANTDEPPYQVKGQTAFFDALQEGISLLDPVRPGDVIYAFTDGGDNRSRSKPREVEKALLSAGVRFFAFIYYDSRRQSEGFLGPALLDKLIEATGGSWVVFPPPGSYSSKFSGKQAAAVKAAARQVYGEMTEFYRLEVELPVEMALPHAPQKLRGWKLEVVDERGKKRKDLTVHYPEKLAPCRGSEQPPAASDDE